MVIKNRKGWIRIVESFIAVLMILSIILLVIERNSFEEGPSGEIYEIERSILRIIQLDNSPGGLREKVLGATIPVDSTSVNFPPTVLFKINEKKPSHLTCITKICAIEDDCNFEGSNEIKKDIYSQSVPIFADLNNYKPRQLKIFCWAKD